MSLRLLRHETSPAEHEAAVAQAERRLGRQLTTSERQIDIVAVDRDLKNGKAELVVAIQAEQDRAARDYVNLGMPIRLNLTARMKRAVEDLYDAGAEHATAELKAAGIDVGD